MVEILKSPSMRILEVIAGNCRCFGVDEMKLKTFHLDIKSGIGDTRRCGSDEMSGQHGGNSSLAKRHYYGYDPETGIHKFDCRDCRNSWVNYKPERAVCLAKDIPYDPDMPFAGYYYCDEPLRKKDWLELPAEVTA